MGAKILHPFKLTQAEAPGSGVPGGPMGPNEWNDGHQLYLDWVPITDATYTVQPGDIGSVLNFSAAGAQITLGTPVAGRAASGSTLNLYEGWFCFFRNSSSGTVTLNPPTGIQIEMLAQPYVLFPGDEVAIFSNGTHYRLLHLAFGTPAGGNMISNSDCLTTSGFVMGWGNTGQTPQFGWGPNVGAQWAPTDMGSVYLMFPGTPGAGLVHDIGVQRFTGIGSYSGFPVQAGQWYEFSAYASVARAIGAQVYMDFFDSAGNALAAPFGNLVNGEVSGPLLNWLRTYVIAQAPPTAATVSLALRTTYDGTDASPYTFATGFLFAPANPNQLFPSPWRLGGPSLIDPGQIPLIDGGTF